MEIKFPKSIYSIDQILRASYVFTDQAYIHLDDDEKYVYVYVDAKDQSDLSNVQGELKNEVLAQVLRESISVRTKNIRELIFQRAMSSSMIVPDNHFSNLQTEECIDVDLGPILKDWFDGEGDKK